MGQVKQFTCKMEWLDAFLGQWGEVADSADTHAGEASFVRNK